MNNAKTYIFSTASVRVVDLTETAGFTVAEVFDISGKLIHEIRTTKKGRYAAVLAFHDALRCRLV